MCWKSDAGCLPHIITRERKNEHMHVWRGAHIKCIYLFSVWNWYTFLWWYIPIIIKINNLWKAYSNNFYSPLFILWASNLLCEWRQSSLLLFFVIVLFNRIWGVDFGLLFYTFTLIWCEWESRFETIRISSLWIHLHTSRLHPNLTICEIVPVQAIRIKYGNRCCDRRKLLQFFFLFHLTIERN